MSDNICPICLDTLCDSSCRKLTVCGHAFHPECIMKWLDSNTTCPLCRSSCVGHEVKTVEPTVEVTPSGVVYWWEETPTADGTTHWGLPPADRIRAFRVGRSWIEYCNGGRSGPASNTRANATLSRIAAVEICSDIVAFHQADEAMPLLVGF